MRVGKWGGAKSLGRNFVATGGGERKGSRSCQKGDQQPNNTHSERKKKKKKKSITVESNKNTSNCNIRENDNGSWFLTLRVKLGD